MNNPRLYLFILLSILMVSCVPSKDLIYLQHSKDAVDTQVTPSAFKPYRLQTNDVLNITIKAIDPKLVEIFNNSNVQATNIVGEQTSYYNGYSVDDHGNIRMPMLGEINVLGFTTEEVRMKIEKQLSDQYFKEQAGVFVSVKMTGFRYTINGEVANTGTKTLYQDRVNIMEAIANAGDINVTGDRKDVKVIRRFPQGNETFSIDLTTDKAMQSPCYYLQPNDYIYIKPLKQKTWGTGKTGIESLTTVVTAISLATTVFLLLRN